MIRELFILLLSTGLCTAAEIVKFNVVSQNQDKYEAQPVEINVNLQQSESKISSRFVGFTIDTQQVRYNWNGLNFSSKSLQNMARALSPAYFRLGGSAADVVTYDMNTYINRPVQKGELHCDHFTEPFNMTADQWENLNQFIKIVGWDFIMDLNGLQRDIDGSWNPNNARQLLQFSYERNYLIAGFELGNEYNVWPLNFNKSISPTQLAADHMILQRLLSQFPTYYSSFIVGPETSSSVQKYFQGFLAAGGYKFVRAASCHHYYFSAHDHPQFSWFTDIKMMDGLGSAIDDAFNQSRKEDPLLPLWLSETSSAWGCGAANMSDRFAAGFLWLDKLGLSAVKGVQTVIRQDFYGFNYGLIDLDSNPNPDFWLTVLFKRIVQGSVFKASANSTSIRIYAACANRNNFNAGSLAFYFLNPNNYSVALSLPQFATQTMLVYSLTAGDSNGLSSDFCALNGVKLQLSGDELPDLPPRFFPGEPVTLEPLSFGFIVMAEARVSICLE